MKHENILRLIDKSRPTVENLEKIREKIVATYGDIMQWPYVVDASFEQFETSVKVCAR